MYRTKHPCSRSISLITTPPTSELPWISVPPAWHKVSRVVNMISEAKMTTRILFRWLICWLNIRFKYASQCAFHSTRGFSMNLVSFREETTKLSKLLSPEMNWRLTCALRGSPPAFPLPANVTCKKVDFRNNFNDVVGVSLAWKKIKRQTITKKNPLSTLLWKHSHFFRFGYKSSFKKNLFLIP